MTKLKEIGSRILDQHKEGLYDMCTRATPGTVCWQCFAAVRVLTSSHGSLASTVKFKCDYISYALEKSRWDPERRLCGKEFSYL